MGASLCVERVQGTSVVSSAFAASPLRLLTPRNHGHAAWAYTSSLGGGFVDGDHLRLDVRVGPGAAAMLGTQGATRVYRSARGASSELRAEVHGLLCVLPDPTVCFAGARYTQRTSVELAADARLVLVEGLAAGRSGERWAFARYESTLRVSRDGAPLFDETTLLDPAHGALQDRMGRIDALLTLVVVGVPFTPALDGLQSASAIQGGVIVRIGAAHVEDAVRALRKHLQFLPALLGDDPFARRP